jgi:hypothetical protein
MSEYQYCEFQTVDRPLTEEQMAELTRYPPAESSARQKPRSAGGSPACAIPGSTAFQAVDT